MHQGRIVECGDAASVFAEPKHPYTQELLASMPSLESIYQQRFA
jgi:oligopeptide/dipeptide ABC transporter ATP-binding protein